MFDLRDDGSIAIDFTIPPSEEGGEPTVQSIVVKSPPSFGAYKRLRSEIEAINTKQADLARQLREDESVEAGEMTSRLTEFMEDAALGWWAFVINGDDTFKGLGSERAPEDRDAWPVYLVSNDAITSALVHWKSVPLARSGKPIPKT